KAIALDLYRVMRRIRDFEERSTVLFGEGKVWGTIHSYAGEEAIAAGVCAHLRDDDWITSTHRGHGHCIAKRADLGKMYAELLGRETGYCRGRGGSMHIADTSKGNLGANGIVGGGIPIATGAALTAKQLGTDQVAVSFFGDGAANQGGFHESANLAALWKLPVIYVCEVNQYAESLPVERGFPIKDISTRAAGYGMPGVRVNGLDVRAVYEAAGALVDGQRRARDGSGARRDRRRGRPGGEAGGRVRGGFAARDAHHAPGGRLCKLLRPARRPRRARCSTTRRSATRSVSRWSAMRAS